MEKVSNMNADIKDLQDLIQEQEITDVLVLYQIPGFLKDRNISKLVWG